MTIIDHFFCRKEITPRIIECSFYNTLFCPTPYCRSGKCPAVIHQTGRVCSRSPHIIRTIRIGNACFCSGGKCRSPSIDIRRSSQTTESKRSIFNTINYIFISERIIQSAKARIIETSPFLIIEIDTVYIGRRCRLIITSYRKTHRTVIVSGSIQINII